MIQLTPNLSQDVSSFARNYGQNRGWRRLDRIQVKRTLNLGESGRMGPPCRGQNLSQADSWPLVGLIDLFPVKYFPD